MMWFISLLSYVVMFSNCHVALIGLTILVNLLSTLNCFSSFELPLMTRDGGHWLTYRHYQKPELAMVEMNV